MLNTFTTNVPIIINKIVDEYLPLVLNKNSHILMKKIKNLLDSKNILNTGKSI